MYDEPLRPPIELTPPQAEAILQQWLGRAVRCRSLRPLPGGCCYTVLEVDFDGPESPVVFKLEVPDAGSDGSLKVEYEILQYYRQRTPFPVPEPLGCGARGELAYLILERLPGGNLGEARSALGSKEEAGLQREMAEAVAELHTHRGERYGDALSQPEGDGSWLAHFGPKLAELHQDNVELGLVSREGLGRIGRVVEALPRMLEGPGEPVLVHGDLWAANIIVDRGHLSGFVDPCGLFAPREYELAYLELWRTVGEPFFEVYQGVHPRLAGNERRRMVYWLHTLLLHVWLFRSEHYVRATDDLAARFSL